MSSAGFRSPWARSTDAPTAGEPVENMHYMQQMRRALHEAGGVRSGERIDGSLGSAGPPALSERALPSPSSGLGNRR